MQRRILPSADGFSHACLSMRECQMEAPSAVHTQSQLRVLNHPVFMLEILVESCVCAIEKTTMAQGYLRSFALDVRANEQQGRPFIYN